MNALSALGPLASVASGLWTTGARGRAALYAAGLLRQHRLQAPVISVGNLSWGGTGKTPFTLWLAARLQAAGLRVSVLTRGYRRTSRERVLLFPPGAPPEDAAGAGDEAQLYLRHLHVPVAVAASRVEAGRAVEGQFPVDVHLLDDGFQHLTLARDLDIVLVDASNPWGAGRGLPRLLREGPAALRRAQVTLLTRCERVGAAALDALQQRLLQANPAIRCFTASTRLLHFAAAADSSRLSLDEARAQSAVAFCGVASPESFFELLENAGISLAAKMSFPDHHRYAAADLESLERTVSQKRADFLLTTEKDIVNLPPVASLPAPLFWAATELAIPEETELLGWIGRRLGFALTQTSGGPHALAEKVSGGRA